MAQKNENGVRLLKAMRGPQAQDVALKVIKVVSTDPNPITFVFEGSSQALDLDIFEVPVSMYPLRKGDRLLVLKLVGSDTDGLRWAALAKINGGVTLATMQSTSSLKVAGIEKTYGASDLVIPPYVVGENGNPRPLKAGDTVSITPTLSGGRIKYVILERY